MKISQIVVMSVLVTVLICKQSEQQLKSEATVFYVFPESCYNKYIAYDWWDMNCLKVSCIRCLGYIIVVLSTIAKVPQIVNIVKAKSTGGLSMTSILVESIGYSLMVGYNMHYNYPFSTYGELVFLLIQNILILSLFLFYDHSLPIFQFLFNLGVIAGVLGLFVLDKVPAEFFHYNILVNIVITLMSRLPQIVLNFQNESTGALSLITSTLFFGGAVARLITIFSEVSDNMLLALYVISTSCNAIILLQILLFWDQTQQKAAEEAEFNQKKKQ